MAEDQNLDQTELGQRAEFMRPGTTDVKSFLPFGGASTNDMPPITFSPEAPVSVRNPRNPSETPTLPKDAVRDTTVGFDPFAVDQLSQPQQNSENFTKSIHQRLLKSTANMSDTQVYSKPYMYDASPSGAHKARYKAYGQETYDRIGFNPEVNNEEIFNANTSMFDDFVRMGTNAFLPMAWNGITANPKSYAQLFQGNIGQDLDASEKYEEWNAIGMSTKGGLGGFFNNTLNSLAYSAGIMLEAALEYAAIGAIEGAIVGPEGSVAGGLLGGAAGAIKGLASVPKNLYNMGKYGGKMLTNLKNLENYTAAKNLFVQASKGTVDFINPINNTTTAFAEASNLSGLARTAKTSAGFFRDVIGMNMALSEGRLEGGFVENNVYTKLYDEYWKKNGKAPDNVTQGRMKQRARIAGAQDTYKNAALVFWSNKFAFPNLVKGNLFAGKSGVVRSVGKEFDIFFNAGKKGVQGIKEGAYEVIDFNFKNALKGFFKPATFGNATLNYFKTNLVEGGQEVMQDIIAKSTEDYYVNSFYDPSKANFDYSMATLGSAFGHQVSAEGFETFMSGFVMGGLLKPFGGAVPRYASTMYTKYMMDPAEYDTYIKERKGFAETVASAMNNMHQNPLEFLSDKSHNLGVQSTLARVINDDETSQMEKRDAANTSFLSDVLTSLNAGTFKVFTDNFEKYNQLNDKELEQTLELQEGEGSKMRTMIKDYVEKARTTQKAWDYAQDTLGKKKLNLQNFKEGTPEMENAQIYNKAIDRSINNLVFLQETFKDNLKRINGITDKFNQSKILSKLPSANFQTLTDHRKLDESINMLQQEIESLKTLDNPQSQAQVEEKTKLLESLSKFQNTQNEFFTLRKTIDNLELLKSEISKRKLEEGETEEDRAGEIKEFETLINSFKDGKQNPIDAHKEAFTDVLKVLAGDQYELAVSQIESGKLGGLDSIYTDLMDYYELTLQGKNLSQYVNMLTQPASFYEHVERNAQWMRNLWLNRKNYYKQIVDESIKTKENNDLLKALADQNIFVDLDQFADWKEDHENLPDYFIDASSGSERIIPKGSLMYDKYASLFEQVARMQEYAAAGDPVDIEGQFEEAKNDLMDKKAKELDEAETNFKSDIKEETGSTVEELEEQQAQLEAQREQQTKVKDSRDFTKANTAFQEILEVLKSDDPAVVDRAITEFLRKEILTTENEEGEIVPVTEDELQASLDEFVQNPQFVKSSIIPKIQLYPETYDLELRKVAGGRAAALEALIEQELLLLEETAAEEPVAEEVQVEEPVAELPQETLVEQTRSWKDYQKAIEAIEEKYALLLQDLVNEFAKKGATTITPDGQVVPQEVSVTDGWDKIRRDHPALYDILDTKFKEAGIVTEADDNYEQVRDNWLETQGDIVKTYNEQLKKKKDAEIEESKKFRLPILKYFKLPKALQNITQASKVAPYVAIREGLQNILDTEQILTSTRNGVQKFRDATAGELDNVRNDVAEFDRLINWLREYGVIAEPNKFDKAFQVFKDKIQAKRAEVQEIRNENGKLVERRLAGKVASRVTKEAEKLDIELTPGKKPFVYFGIDKTKTRTITNEEGIEEEVEIPAPILSAYESIVNDDSIPQEAKVDTFLTAFQAFVNQGRTNVFRDRENKGPNVEKFRILKESLEADFSEENLIANIQELAFKQNADVGNMLDDLIKDFLTREGLFFKKISKPEKMSQRAYDSLFGTTGVITKFRDGIIDGNYKVVGASDLLFDTDLLDSGLVGETDLIAINADGDFEIIDVKALGKGSWQIFNADTELNALKKKLQKENVSDEDIANDPEVIKLEKSVLKSKKQYFRIQQSIYRNLFYNMTGLMPKRIGLMAIQVEIDNEGNLLEASLAPFVQDDYSTIELEYIDAVESIVPLKAAPAETQAVEGQLTEDPEKSLKLSENVNQKVIFNGKVGTLVFMNGEYGVKIGDEIQDLLYEQSAVINGDLSLKDVGITPVTATTKIGQVTYVNNQRIDAKILGSSTAVINGVTYKLNRNNKGQIVSMSYRANDKQIFELEDERQVYIEEVARLQRENLDVLSDSKKNTYNQRIANLTSKIRTFTPEQANEKNDALEERAKLQKELEDLTQKQNANIRTIANYNIEKQRVDREIVSLKEDNPLRTMRGGNFNDYIFALNALPESFKLYKGETPADQKKDLTSIGRLSTAPGTASQIDAILEKDFPNALNTLIEKGVDSISPEGLDSIMKWANLAITDLSVLGSRLATQNNLTTDVDNQINAIYDLLNDLELIKLTKDGKIDKRYRKQAEKAFGPQKVSDRTSLSEDEKSTRGKTKGVSGRKAEPRSATIEEMQAAVVPVPTAEDVLSGIEVEVEVETSKEAVKLIDNINKATVESLDQEYFKALDYLTKNPGKINPSDITDAYTSRKQNLNTDLSFNTLKKGDYLMSKTPIFDNEVATAVVITKKSKGGIMVRDIASNQTAEYTQEEVNQNFVRMTEEAFNEFQGPEITPEDVEEFKKNIEVIDDTLNDVAALNDVATQVEKGETKGSFRDNLRNKNCNI